MKRRMWMGMATGMGLALVAGSMLPACESQPMDQGEGQGTLQFPLISEAPSGVRYRLRDAVFDITSQYYYYGESSAGGAGGTVLTVSSEDDVNAESIRVSVERGYYYVRLRPGWHMEKLVGDEATPVEAQLLTGESQWAYVNPRSTSSVEYSFGIGGRAIWFNGKLNINIHVYDDPDQVYGAGGYVGVGGAGE